VPLRLLSGFLVLVAAYLVWWSVVHDHLPWLAGAALMVVAAVGLWMGKNWAEYLWHGIAAATVVLWVVMVVRVALSGWPYSDPLSSVISLIPGLLLVLICISGSIVVRRQYGRRSSAL
jgi:hypothetical protein